MHWTSTTRRLGLALVVTLLLAATAAAEPARSNPADVLLGTIQIEWVPTQEFAGLKLTVSGPEGVSEQYFAPGENPRFDLAALASGVDGLYTWELTARPLLDETATRALAEARVKGQDGNRTRPASLPPRDSLIQTGSFRVVDGAIVQPAEEVQNTQPRRVVAAANRALAETVISGDLTVYNALCVGFDCATAETYGADSIRLKENNLRIHFDDTSNSGSFPRNDWRLVANDQANGGRNVFFLEDSTTGREVFSVEAAAPSNALWVDANGNVGFGTSTPVVQLHIKDGNTPGVRLEQDTSSGFAAQTWDIAGNEANFFVRSASTGSQLPFRIRPGAPTSSIDIAADGDIGIGTASPQNGIRIHAVTADPNVALFESTEAINDVAFLLIQNAGSTDFNSTGVGSFNESLILRAGDATRLTIEATGALTSSTGASLTSTGVWTDASSRSLKQEIEELSLEDALAAVRELKPVTFRYNANLEEQYVGFIAEDVPDLVAMKDRKGLAPMEIVAALTRVVQMQQERIDELSLKLGESAEADEE